MQTIGWNLNDKLPIDVLETPYVYNDASVDGTVYTTWQSDTGNVLIRKIVTSAGISTVGFSNSVTWANRASGTYVPYEQLHGVPPYQNTFPTPIPFKQ